MQSLYQFTDYRDYLIEWTQNHPSAGHGSRKRMAEFLRCQGAFVSQVLHKTTHFTLEHAISLNTFLEHNQEESDYFLLLVQYQRAGSKDLHDYFQKKIEAIHAQRLVLKNRISSEAELSEEAKLRYYSTWHVGAIRLLLTIPEYQSKEKIIRRLKLPPNVVGNVLEFLCSVGLAEQSGDRFLPGTAHLHLGNDSPLRHKHHTNWRVQAMRALDIERENDLHYSLGMTISQADVIQLKALMVDFIESVQKIARPSEPETLVGLCMDFFET